MKIDFYNNNGEAKHYLLKVIWANKDRLNFIIDGEEYNKNCKITLHLGKYIVRSEVPFKRTDRWVSFHLYRRKMFGLYESNVGCVILEQGRGSSLESLIENYVNAKVEELRKAINEAEEVKQSKVNAEFVEYLKENYSTSD